MKWLLIPERINCTILEITFKGLLNERVPSNRQISIKNNQRELKKSTKDFKLILTNDPNYSSHFLEYATKWYNEVSKPLREVDNFCEMISKLKKYLFYITLAHFLLIQTEVSLNVIMFVIIKKVLFVLQNENTLYILSISVLFFSTLLNIAFTTSSTGNMFMRSVFYSFKSELASMTIQNLHSIYLLLAISLTQRFQY